MKFFFIILVFSQLFTCNAVSAQVCFLIEQPVKKGVDFCNGKYKPIGDFESRQILEILHGSGYAQATFSIRVIPNLRNCVATICGNKRIVLLGESLIPYLKKKDDDTEKYVVEEESLMFTIVHEIGHHLLFHTVTGNQSSKWANECAADEFASFSITHEMDIVRVDLISFTTFLEFLEPEKRTGQYPDLIRRQEAVARGWYKAKAKSSMSPIIDLKGKLAKKYFNDNQALEKISEYFTMPPESPYATISTRPISGKYSDEELPTRSWTYISDGEAFKLRGDIFLRQKKTSKAARAFGQAIDRFYYVEAPELLLEYAQTIANSDYKKAIKSCDRYIDYIKFLKFISHPTYIYRDHNFNMAQAIYVRASVDQFYKKFDSAVVQFQTALEYANRAQDKSMVSSITRLQLLAKKREVWKY